MKTTEFDFDAIAAFKGEPAFDVTADRTALLVIDMQRYFVEPHHPWGRTWATFFPVETTAYFDRVNGTVIPNIQKLLSKCRELADL